MFKTEMSKYYGIIFSHYLILNFIFFFLPLYFLEIGLTGLQTGILMGVFSITGLLFSFHAGIKSDQVQQRTIINIGIIMFVVFCIGFAYLTNFWILTILIFIGGIGRTLIARATETLVLKSTQDKTKGKHMAMLHIMRDFPLIIGIIIGAYIIHFLGFADLFLWSGILSMFIIIPVLTIKNTRLFHFSVHHYIDDLKNRKALYFFAIIFVFSLHFGSEQVAYTPFLKNYLGLSIFNTSYYIAASIVFLLIAIFAAGRMVDKKASIINLISYSMLLSGLGGALFAMTKNVWWSFFFRIIHELGDGAIIVVFYVGIIILFKKERIGGNAGFLGVVMILATVVGSIIFGPIGYRLGYHVPHIISGALAIAAALMLMVWKKFVRES